jgi:uncharacterized protein (DUF433 family)
VAHLDSSRDAELNRIHASVEPRRAAWIKSDTICDVHILSGHIVNAHLNRISIDPLVCFGQPCIKGTRIWVSLIIDLLAEGLSEQEILSEYPQLKRDDILAALAYGAEMAREHIIPIATEKAALNLSSARIWVEARSMC